jgi:hypothetical protein
MSKKSLERALARNRAKGPRFKIGDRVVALTVAGNSIVRTKQAVTIIGVKQRPRLGAIYAVQNDIGAIDPSVPESRIQRVRPLPVQTNTPPRPDVKDVS